MENSVLNGIATVASIVGFVGWLWQISRRRGTPLTRWASFVVSLLFLVVAGKGVSSYFAAPRALTPDQGASGSISVTASSLVDRSRTARQLTDGRTADAVAADPPTASAPASTEPKQMHRELAAPINRFVDFTAADPTNGVAIAIVNGKGEREQPLIDAATETMTAAGRHPVAVFSDAAITAQLPRQLVAGSTDLLRQSHLAEACREVLVGTIERVSERETDAALQGLVTTRLHIRIRLIETESGTALRSFDRDVRGAGYTEAAAETQALERAAAAIRQELNRSRN